MASKCQRVEFEPKSVEPKSWPLSFFQIRPLNTWDRQTWLLKSTFDPRQKGCPNARHELGKG